MIILRKIEGEVNSAARRAVVDTVTETMFGCRVVRDQMGAPSLKHRIASISISHTDRYVAIAVWNKEVGIDIELFARRVDHLAQRFATVDELRICADVQPDNPPLLVWCAKEAIYKTMHRQGVDFLRDITITDAYEAFIEAVADGRPMLLEWEIMEQNDDLLVVCTI